MKYKNQIDRSLEDCENLVATLALEVESGKSYVTGEYVAQRLAIVKHKIEDARNYLNLEDE
jgi:hypothetical protein